MAKPETTTGSSEQCAARYSRQISLSSFGTAGQARLARSQALIVGAGGLGNPAGLYLANAGIGQIVVSDFDTIDASNLHRQILFRDEDIGHPKAEVMALRLVEANPHLAAVGISRRLDGDALREEVRHVNVVLDCTDNFRSRWLLNEVCHEMATPLISGAVIRFEGQLSVFRFDRESSPCYRCLYAEEDENLGDCEGQGVLGPVAGTVGTMMATEAIKVLAGVGSDLDGRLWVYDGLNGVSRCLAIPRRSDCPVCRDGRRQATGSA